MSRNNGKGINLQVAGVVTTEERLRKALDQQRRLEAENLKLRMEMQERADVFQGMRGLVTPPPRYHVTNRPKGKPGRPRVEAHFGAADLHTGAFSHPAQSSGRVLFSWDLLWWGWLDIVQRWSNMLEADLAKFDLQSIQFWFAGDIVNGELRRDDLVSNEFPPAVQTLCAGKLMATALARVAARFPNVPVIAHCIPGNHDRMDDKQPSNDAMNRSHALNVYAGAQDSCQKVANIDVRIYQDTQPAIEYRPGKVAVLTHGHGVRINKRMPYYGLRDLYFTVVQEAIDAGRPIPEFLLCGHFHEFGSTDDGRVIVMPSAMGPSLWSRSAGFRGTPAQLVFYTGEHGPFGFTPLARRLPDGYKVPEYVNPWERIDMEAVHA